MKLFKGFLNYSLQLRLVLLLIFTLIVSVWGLISFIEKLLQSELYAEEISQQQEIANYMAGDINSHLAFRVSSLQSVANEITSAQINSPQALQQLLSERPIFQAVFNGGIFVTGRDGTAIASLPASANRIGVSYIDRDYILGALKLGKPMIGSPVMGRELNSPVFVISAPIKDTNGEIIGVLAGVTDLGKSSFLDHFTDYRYGKTGYLLLVDASNRMIITSTDRSRTMQPLPPKGHNPMIDRLIEGYDETGITVSPLGIEVLATAKHLSSSNWYVVAALPTAEAFSLITQLDTSIIQGSLMVIMLATVLFFWIVWRQFAALRSSAKRLHEQSESGVELQPLPEAGRDEVGVLIAAINHLTGTLAIREKSLHQARNQLKTLIQSLPDLVWLKDTKGVYLLCNSRFESFFGKKESEIIGKTDYDFVGKPLADFFRENDKIAMAAGKSTVNEELITFAEDGHQELLETTKTPMYELDGQLIGVLGIGHDITKRKKDERDLLVSEERLRLALETARQSWFDLDLKTGNANVGPQLAEILGYDPGEFESTFDNWTNTLHPDDKDDVLKQIDEALKSRERISVEYRRLDKQGMMCQH